MIVKKATTNTRKKISTNSLLHLYRDRVMNLIIFLLLAFFLVAEVCYNIPQTLRDSYNELILLNAAQVENYEKYVNDANELYTSLENQDYLFTSQLYARQLNNQTNLKKAIRSLNKDVDDTISAFYLKSDGTVISDKNRRDLTLTDEQLDELKDEGYLNNEDDECRYFLAACDNGWLIQRVDNSSEAKLKDDVLKYISLDGFIFNDSTLDITVKDDEDYPSNVGSMYVSEPIESELFTDPDIKMVLISPYTHGIAKYLNMELASIGSLSYQMEGYSYCAYMPVTQIVFYIFLHCGVPTLLFIIFILLSIHGCKHLSQIKINNQSDTIIKLPFNCCINITLLRNILVMLFVPAMLVLFCSVVFMIISRLSVYNVNHQFYTQQYIDINSNCEQIVDDCQEAYSEPMLEMADAVNELLAEEGLDNNDSAKNLMKQLVKNTYIEEIAVYDRNGENVFTTADSAGYPLSRDEDSQQYQFRELINGSENNIIVRSDTDDNYFYCAESRSDQIGVIVLKADAEKLSEFENRMSSKSIAVKLGYCDSYLFVDSDNSDKFYQITSSGKTTKYTNQNIPVLTNKDTLCGFRFISNNFYFISGIGSEDYSIYYIVTILNLLASVPLSTVNIVVFLIIISILLVAGSTVYCTENVDIVDIKEPSHKKLYNRVVSKFNRKVSLNDNIFQSQMEIWRQSFVRVMVLIVFVLLLDALMDSCYLMYFMFLGHWEKGINIFALFFVMLVVMAAFAVYKALDFMFDEFTVNLPKSSITTCHMLHSIINIVIVIWMMLFSASQIGINTTTIVASVGVTGIVIGLASQSTINDMLNGIFIILDKRIQIGDFVEVGGFYGMVSHIGIRTTKIICMNKEKSVNNSSMLNLVNYSRGTARIELTFSVPFNTDLELLSKVISESTPRFQAYCDGKLKSNVAFMDVSQFNDFGTIKCLICADVEESDRIVLTSKCGFVLK